MDTRKSCGHLVLLHIDNKIVVCDICGKVWLDKTILTSDF